MNIEKKEQNFEFLLSIFLEHHIYRQDEGEFCLIMCYAQGFVQSRSRRK